jgi:hypothetical protein
MPSVPTRTDLPPWADAIVPAGIKCDGAHTGRVWPVARYRIKETPRGKDREPWYACGHHLKQAELFRSRADERQALEADRSTGLADMESALKNFRIQTGVDLSVTAQHVPDGTSGDRLLTMTPAQVVHLAAVIRDSNPGAGWPEPSNVVRFSRRSELTRG